MNVKFTKEDTNILKGIAILMMLFHHLFGFPDRVAQYMTVETGSLIQLLGRFGRLCVPIFVFISGYGMYVSYAKDRDALHKIPGRLWNLYKMLWRVMVVFVTLGLILGCFSVTKDTLITIVQSAVGYISADSVINGEWWFFSLYVMLILLSPLTLKFIHTRGWLWSLIVIFSMDKFLNNCLPVLYNYNVFQNILSFGLLNWFYTCLIWYLTPFLFGAYIAKYQVIEKMFTRINVNVLSILSIAGISVSFYAFINVRDLPFWNTLYAFCFVIFSKSVIARIPHVKQIFIQMGNESGYMWLIHSFFIYTIFPRVTFIFGNKILTYIWFVVLTYVSSYLIHHGFETLETKLKKKSS